MGCFTLEDAGWNNGALHFKISLIKKKFFGGTLQHVRSKFLDRGLNLRPLNLKAVSKPLDHQGSPSALLSKALFPVQ